MVVVMQLDSAEKVLIRALVFFVGAFFLLAVLDYQESQEWEQFMSSHKCKIISKSKGESITGIGYGFAGNGQFGTVITSSSIPDKTGYLCDDGITYWR
jgi:hypothetical protein